MKKIDGGRLVAEALKSEGVQYVFSVSGGVLNPIYHACEELGIQIIHARHEAAAAFMADGWARTTGKPGVVLTTLGPGLTNTITGIFTAYRATSPIIVLSGQTSQSTRDMEAGMSVDPLPLVSSITKWAKSVAETKRIPEYISSAFRYAITGRPGPVFLEVPSDVLLGQVDYNEYIPINPETSRPHSVPQADRYAAERAVALIEKSERPLAIAGSGSFWSKATDELRVFIEKFNLPFFLARAGRGVIPEDHPLYFGPGYIPANPVIEKALKETDLLLLLGHRLDFDLNFGRSPSLNREAKIIQVDIEPSEIGRYRPVQVGIPSDLRSALTTMSDLSSRKHDISIRWLESLESERDLWEEETEQEISSYSSLPMHPLRFLREISKSLPKKSVLITSHGNIDFWADAQLRIYQPGGYIRAGQSGSLGAEIPYGLAAKLARPDEPVVAIVGDGGFGYHCMELDTAARYGAPFIIAIGNDAAWGAISLPQERVYGRAISTGLEFRNYERIAEVLGGYGELVEKPEQVGQAVCRALESKLPSVLNINIASIESRYMYEISK
jgi:acetolactate synthase-1/2/3 large subunit